MRTENFRNRIQETYPELQIHTVEYLNEGQFNHVLVINDNLIFRFPRYAHVIDQLETERVVLDQIRPHLPLPIPKIIYQLHDARIPGEVFTGYQMIPGRPLYRERLKKILDEAVMQRVAEQAAAFLKALHHIERNRLSVPVRVEDPLDYYENFYSEIRTALLPKMRPSARVETEAYFEQLLGYLRQHSYRPCLIHNDYGGSNILFDDTRQELSGVIDFNSLCVGDPAVDVASLSTYGEDFIRRGMRVYPEMENLLERARLIKGTFALEEAYSGWRDDDSEAFRRGMEKYV
jgi:aminoglycoside 2''-phosphotransferase